MYHDFKVLISSVKGKTVLYKNKTKKAVYVQLELERTYKPEKKYNVAKRTVIGRVCPDDKTRMFPNDNFLKLFPDYAVPEETPDADRSCCLKLGPWVVIKKLVREYGLKELLEKQLGKDAGLFLDLLSYLIVNEDNAGQYYPDYAFCHPLFTENMRVYSDSTVSRLFNRITKDDIFGFLDEWNAKRDHRQRIYVSYDSTNKNCQAGDTDILEFGNAKESKDTPIFNLAVAYDKTNQVPLFYEEYPGSINDVSQFRYLVDKVRAYNYRNIGFILDRGYFSRENIRTMDKNGHPFIMMVKGSEALVTSIVEGKKGSFEESRKCRVATTRIYATTVSCPFEGRDRYFHVYFNPTKAADERGKLESELDKATEFLKTFIGKEIGETTGLVKRCFELHRDQKNRLVAFEEKDDVIERELRLCGYFCIVTSEKMSASEAFFLYKGRDPSEKLFRVDKTFLGSRSARVHSNEALSAKIWLEFVALIVRNRIYNLLKDEMLRLNVRKNYMTVPTAIKELEKIELVRRSGGLYRLDHAITKSQQEILKSFGIAKEDVYAEAASVAAILKKAATKTEQKELTDEQREDDDESARCEDYEDNF